MDKTYEALIVSANTYEANGTTRHYSPQDYAEANHLEIAGGVEVAFRGLSSDIWKVYNTSKTQSGDSGLSIETAQEEDAKEEWTVSEASQEETAEGTKETDETKEAADAADQENPSEDQENKDQEETAKDEESETSDTKDTADTEKTAAEELKAEEPEKVHETEAKETQEIKESETKENETIKEEETKEETAAKNDSETAAPSEAETDASQAEETTKAAESDNIEETTAKETEENADKIEETTKTDEGETASTPTEDEKKTQSETKTNDEKKTQAKTQAAEENEIAAYATEDTDNYHYVLEPDDKQMQLGTAEQTGGSSVLQYYRGNVRLDYQDGDYEPTKVHPIDVKFKFWINQDGTDANSNPYSFPEGLQAECWSWIHNQGYSKGNIDVTPSIDQGVAVEGKYAISKLPRKDTSVVQFLYSNIDWTIQVETVKGSQEDPVITLAEEQLCFLFNEHRKHLRSGRRQASGQGQLGAGYHAFL